MYDLIETVRKAQTPEQFWNAQILILRKILELEKTITRRREQQATVKNAKLAYTHKSNKKIEEKKK